MKRYITALSLVITLSVTADSGFGNYSTGYRMGKINKYGIKGLISKSGEGQMLMGKDSTELKVTEGEGEDKRVLNINPWYFSVTDKTIRETLKDYQGKYVTLKYKQSHIKNMFKTDTEYSIIDIIPITDKVTEPCINTKYDKGSKSHSKRTGRIVKMSSKGTMVNSYEIILQEGDAGNSFKRLSITSKDMYDCTLKYLKAGQRVDMEYSDSFLNLNILNRETTYDVMSVSPSTSNTLN